MMKCEDIEYEKIAKKSIVNTILVIKLPTPSPMLKDRKIGIFIS